MSSKATVESIENQAKKEHINLTPQHQEVINFVVNFYEKCDSCKNARELMNKLAQHFSTQGGKKYLYRLFPQGPLSQIHRLTNRPNLMYQVDKSFGTSY